MLSPVGQCDTDNECEFKQPLIRFWRKSIFWYCFIIIGFAYLFQNYGSLCSNSLAIDNFFDCLYFSVVTFHTIGYRDIIPNDDLTKKFIIIESITSVIGTGLFVGYLIYHLQKIDLDKERKPILDIARGNLLRIVNNFSRSFIPTTKISIVFRPIFFGKIRSFSTFDLKIEPNENIENIVKLDFTQGIKGYFYMKSWEKEEDRSEAEIQYYEKYYINLNKIEEFKIELSSFLQRYSGYSGKELNDIYNILNELEEYLYFNSKNEYNVDDENYIFLIVRISKIVKKALDLKNFLMENYVPFENSNYESVSN